MNKTIKNLEERQKGEPGETREKQKQTRKARPKPKPPFPNF
jgi:hypothetical protein